MCDVSNMGWCVCAVPRGNFNSVVGVWVGSEGKGQPKVTLTLYVGESSEVLIFDDDATRYGNV